MLIAFGVACVFAVYLQLIVGATMRHYDAGLAIPDLPLAYGKVLPPTTSDQLAVVNSHRAFDLNLKPVTLTQIWLHFGHRIGAILVTVMILILATLIFRNHRRDRAILSPGITLLVLLVVQLTLGVLTVLLRKPADIASLHVAVGALVLVTTFVLTVRAMRLYSPIWRAQARRATVVSDQHEIPAEVVPA
jgi:cytochrome c oxidase assembly protein subunit 15